MPKLGDSFPQEKQHEFIRSQITPGKIIRITVPLTMETKTKYSVILNTEDYPPLFVMTRQPSPFVRNNSAMLAMQVLMSMSDYPFLIQDSYLDCSQVIRTVHIDSILREISGETDRIIGDINNNTRTEMISVVTDASTYSAVDRRMILGSL